MFSFCNGVSVEYSQVLHSGALGSLTLIGDASASSVSGGGAGVALVQSHVSTSSATSLLVLDGRGAVAQAQAAGVVLSKSNVTAGGEARVVGEGGPCTDFCEGVLLRVDSSLAIRGVSGLVGGRGGSMAGGGSGARAVKAEEASGVFLDPTSSLSYTSPQCCVTLASYGSPPGEFPLVLGGAGAVTLADARNTVVLQAGEVGLALRDVVFALSWIGDGAGGALVEGERATAVLQHNVPDSLTYLFTCMWEASSGERGRCAVLEETWLQVDAGAGPGELSITARLFFLQYEIASAVSPALSIENTPPVVDAGGPYLVLAGGSVLLHAFATDSSPDLSFAWDLDGDGEFDEANSDTAVFSAGLDPGVVVVWVAVSDGDLTTVVNASVVITLSSLQLTPPDMTPLPGMDGGDGDGDGDGDGGGGKSPVVPDSMSVSSDIIGMNAGPSPSNTSAPPPPPIGPAVPPPLLVRPDEDPPSRRFSVISEDGRVLASLVFDSPLPIGVQLVAQVISSGPGTPVRAVSAILDLSLRRDMEVVQLRDDVELCFDVSDTETDNRCLGYFDEEARTWRCEDRCLSEQDGQLCGDTDHFSNWAVLIAGGAGGSDDPCSEENPYFTGSALWDGLTVAFVFLGILSLCVIVLVISFVPSVREFLYGPEGARILRQRLGVAARPADINL
eukprot:TRINITY_DN13003_c0_g1_i1.p1 TRINITY_DN13003_c0_g1~~TRINITY_DN13003_c0_g1_i1.p1  ORF type:complete len:757 (-),score=152.92 TRINITY_DN13003_c0_g1_i1:123-2141(-)